MKKSFAFIAVTALVIAGCTSQDDPSGAALPTAPSEAPPSTEAPDPQDDSDTGSDFVPSVPVPADLPVYPGAQLWNDLPSGSDWQWMYQTTGSGNEIVAFFIDSDATGHPHSGWCYS